MRRGCEPQPAGQHQPQHRARLGVIGQVLAGGAIDQRVEIGQPAQRLGCQGAGERAVGIAADALQRGRPRLLERLAPAEHGIAQAQRSFAGGESGNVHVRPLGHRAEKWEPVFCK